MIYPHTQRVHLWIGHLVADPDARTPIVDSWLVEYDPTIADHTSILGCHIVVTKDRAQATPFFGEYIALSVWKRERTYNDKPLARYGVRIIPVEDELHRYKSLEDAQAVGSRAAQTAVNDALAAEEIAS